MNNFKIPSCFFHFKISMNDEPNDRSPKNLTFVLNENSQIYNWEGERGAYLLIGKYRCICFRVLLSIPCGGWYLVSQKVSEKDIFLRTKYKFYLPLEGTECEKILLAEQNGSIFFCEYSFPFNRSTIGKTLKNMRLNSFICRARQTIDNSFNEKKKNKKMKRRK